MMTKDGVERMAGGAPRAAELRFPVPGGAVLLDPAVWPAVLGADTPVAEAASRSPDELFEPDFWAGRGECAAVTGGRGAAWFVGSAPREWVLRHYRRGGLVAHLSADAYVWAGERRVRAFAEWRLLEHLASRGLPVPQPIGARYRRRGSVYRCDLITRRIAGARALSALLADGAVADRVWSDVGAVIRRLHAAGADHADLNAHNILLDATGGVSVVDFDRGRLRATVAPAAAAPATAAPANAAQATAAEVTQPPAAGDRTAPAWAARNLARLHRSLVKVSRDLPPDRFTAVAWARLLAGYGA